MPGGRPKGSKNKRTLALEAFASIPASSTAPICPQSPDGVVTPLEYCLGIVNGTHVFDEPKFRAAQAALPYTSARLEKATASKKEEVSERSKAAAVGKFAPPTAPKLIVNNS